MKNNTINKLIKAVEKQLTTKKSVIVSVCGGSCTRKSSLVSAYLVDYFKDKCVLLSQDNFQLQPSYVKNMHPDYRWDHPNNFGITVCCDTLTKLKQNQSVEVPNYNFKKDEPITYKTITPAPIIIFEGLYTNYKGLQNLNDVSVYVKSPWYARMIRRVFRNTLDRYKGRKASDIIDSFCDSVTKAHFDFVKTQEQSSNFVIETELRFDNIIKYYNLKSIDCTELNNNIFFALNGKDNITFTIKNTNLKQFEFLFFYNKKLYLKFDMNSEFANKLKNIDWLAY